MFVPLVYEGIGEEWILKNSVEQKKEYKVFITLTNFDVNHHLYKLVIKYKNIDDSLADKIDEVYIIGKKQQIYANASGKGISIFKFSSNKHKMIFKYNINDFEDGVLYSKYCLKLNKKTH